MADVLTPSRDRAEVALAIGLAVMAGVGVVLLNGVPARYHVAALLAATGIGVLCALPDRRAVCLGLWVLIQPLSVETVFYVAAPVHPRFLPQSIVVNAADALLALLLVFLSVESLFTRGAVFRWTPPTRIWILFLAWALVSWLVHIEFLHAGTGAASPLALLRGIRLLLLAVIVQSAIRTRSDLVLVLLALLVAVLGEAVLVTLSYVTGHVLNFGSLVAPDSGASLQVFSGGGGESIQRATGTLGHTNQQAAFHVFFTLPLIALLAARNRILRVIVLVTTFASGMAILFTFSRTAWMSFPVSLMVVFVLALRRGLVGARAWLIGAALTIGVAAVLAALTPKIYERLAHGDDGATESRLRMMSLATDLFESSPFLGVGPGQYATAALDLYPPEYRRLQWRPLDQPPVDLVFGRLDVSEIVRPGLPTVIQPAQVHNKYLLVLAELGIPGLVIYLRMFRAFLREARLCSKASDPLQRLLGLAGTGAIVAILLYMGFDLFDDDKSMELLLFVPILITAAARIPTVHHRSRIGKPQLAAWGERQPSVSWRQT